MLQRLKNNYSWRLILFCVLLFLFGVAVGCIAGVVGIRHAFFRFHPSPEEISRTRADRIASDFGLDDEVREKIYQENLRHFQILSQKFEEMRDRIDVELANYADTIAPLIADEKMRQRWLIRYRDYFPKGPPPPGPGLPRPPLPPRPQ